MVQRAIDAVVLLAFSFIYNCAILLLRFRRPA